MSFHILASKNSRGTLTLNFFRCLIRLVLCDVTLLWPVEILALNTSQLADTELANCKATVVLAVHSCRLTQVTMRCIHGPAQTTEWNMNQWCGFSSLISNEQIRSIARLIQWQCWIRQIPSLEYSVKVSNHGVPCNYNFNTKHLQIGKMNPLSIIKGWDLLYMLSVMRFDDFPDINIM